MDNLIINEAKKWLGTKFYPYGRNKDSGCDCVGLILGVDESLNLKAKNGKSFSDLEIPKYTFSSQNRQIIEKSLEVYLYQQPLDDFRAGNIALLIYENRFLHLAIMNSNTIIHSYIKARKVIEENFTQDIKMKIIKNFSYLNY